MALFPVIMCGGAGARLWPASTHSRPKPFLDLIGEASLFASTVERMEPLTGRDAEVIVVAGSIHRRAILTELGRLGRSARLLLEPEARASGPAMAVAAIQALRLSPEAVIAVVASDHHVPDAESFRTAVRGAAIAAQDGRIVTLGVRPAWPSSALGYIAPDGPGPGVSNVLQFVEKPNPEQAAGYISRGYLWNSGNFITRADVLIGELRRFAPEMLAAAEASLDGAVPAGGGLLLGQAFKAAPKKSIDYAVMEKTDRASVLPVDFEWSDVGSWDAVLDGGAIDRGEVLRIDAPGGLVRASPGMTVAVVGASDLIVIAEPGQVLVTRRETAGRVREAADHFGPGSARIDTLAAQARIFADWTRLRALPVWSSLGVSPAGWFHETLDADGRPLTPVRRARVQPRQAHALCLAGALGWSGPWRGLTAQAMALFEVSNGLRTGGYRTLLAGDGTSLDDTALNYDLAFVLLARAAMQQPETTPPLLAFLDSRAHPAGGYREAGHRPYQSNANMHLFEAFLAWEAMEPGAVWRDRADALAGLAIDRLIDPQEGFIREVYDADWRPAPRPEGDIVEPGHQFEWAHLLQTWADRRSDASGFKAARRLFQAGLKGVDPVRGVAVDEMDSNLLMTRRTARLWSQTERFKAALALSVADPDPILLEEAQSALTAIWAYLRPEGLWGDVMDEQGRIAQGPSPASSFYHLITAIQQLASASRVLPAFDAPLDLS